jgi:hypothetical protein
MPRIPIGGRWLAGEAGAHELEPPKVEPEPVRKPATVPLYQAAAAHDGQPADAWLVMFYRLYGDLE